MIVVSGGVGVAVGVGVGVAVAVGVGVASALRHDHRAGHRRMRVQTNVYVPGASNLQ